MNPLRFRLLPRQRILNLLSKATRLSATVAACSLLALTARGDDPAEELVKKQNDCKKNRWWKEKSIYSNEESKTLKDEFNPTLRCVKNTGGEHESHNHNSVLQPADLGKSRPSFLNTRVLDHKELGACRAAYEGIKDVYDSLKALAEDYCETYTEAQVNAEKCNNSILVTKICEAQWKKVVEENNKWLRVLAEKRQPIGHYLTSLESAAKTAQKHYLEDFDAIKKEFDRLSAAATRSSVESIADAPQVKSSNGNKDTASSKSLAPYFDLLAGPEILVTPRKGIPAVRTANGPLVLEEKMASEQVAKFTGALVFYVSGEKTLVDSQLKLLADGLKQAEKANSLENPWNKRIGDLSTGLNAAGPIAKLMGPPNKPTGGLSPIAPAASAPLAELAVAGAAGAIAARSFGSSGSSQAPPSGSREIPAANSPPANSTPTGAPDVAKFSDHAEAKPDKGIPGSVAPIAPGKGETANLDPVTSSGGGGINEGSSRALSSKKSAPSQQGGATPSSATADGPAAGNADGMPNFTQNLAPQKTPARNTDPSPGAEVANLLGQMKNLFNFDENGPMGGPGSVTAPPGNSSADPYALVEPGQENNSVEGPAAEAGDTAAQTAAASDNPYEHGKEVQSNLFGKTDTSLFARVRARHHRCMERGLVLYGLRERVE